LEDFCLDVFKDQVFILVKKRGEGRGILFWEEFGEGLNIELMSAMVEGLLFLLKDMADFVKLTIWPD
jgi:hypothetical protein